MLALTTVAYGLVLSPVPRTSPHAAVRPCRVSSIRCGWGPDPIWESLAVETIGDAASGLKAITIVPPAGVAKEFVNPGQYVQIREPGAEKAGIFAIASAPGKDGAFEFLIKEQPASDWSPGTGWLTDSKVGTALEMSQVMGPGFLKSDDALDGIDTVLLFAAGSGISPIRSVMESGKLKDVGSVKLFYGASTPEQMAYQDKVRAAEDAHRPQGTHMRARPCTAMHGVQGCTRTHLLTHSRISQFDEWKAAGVDVTAVISKAEGTEWKGATGYVQDVCQSAGIDDPKSTAILVCGMKGMFEGVKELATEAGMPEDRLLANF